MCGIHSSCAFSGFEPRGKKGDDTLLSGSHFNQVILTRRNILRLLRIERYGHSFKYIFWHIEKYIENHKVPVGGGHHWSERRVRKKIAWTCYTYRKKCLYQYRKIGWGIRLKMRSYGKTLITLARNINSKTTHQWELRALLFGMVVIFYKCGLVIAVTFWE